MASYRTDFQKEHDRAQIARMIREGRRQTEIAAELGVSPQLVSKEIKAMMEAWQNTMLSDIADHKAAELARLNYIERELWEAWEASKKEGRKKNQQWVLPGTPTESDPNPKPVILRACLTTENSCGDPRIMKLIGDISEQRCKLLDLYKPIKMHLTETQEDPSNMTVAERAARILEMIRQIGGDFPVNTPST